MSNSVLDFARHSDPRFNDVSDDDLTQFIAETKPEFFQDPAFAKRYDLVKQKQKLNKPGTIFDPSSEQVAGALDTIEPIVRGATAIPRALVPNPFNPEDKARAEAEINATDVGQAARLVGYPIKKAGELAAEDVASAGQALGISPNSTGSVFAQGLAKGIPMVGASVLLQRLGIPTAAAFGAPPAAETLASGGTPLQAATTGAVGALIPSATEFGGTAGANIGGRIGSLSSNQAVQNAAVTGGEFLGRQVMQNTLAGVQQAPEFLDLLDKDPEAAKKQFIETVASNLAYELPHAPQTVRNLLAKDIVQGKPIEVQKSWVGKPANPETINGAPVEKGRAFNSTAGEGDFHATSGEGEVTKAAQDAVIEAKPAESVEVQDKAADQVADHTAEVAAQAYLPETASVVAEMANKEAPKPEEPTSKPDLKVQPEAPVAEAPVAPEKPLTEQQQLRADSKEFDDLIKEHGPENGWVNNPDLLGSVNLSGGLQDKGSIQAKIRANAELQQARRNVAAMLGEDPNKSSSHLDKQRLLPLLKKHIEEVITPKKQQDEFFSSIQPGEGKTEVPVNDLSIGDTFTVNGEKVEVVGINPDDDSVEVDGGKRFGRQHIAQDSVLGVDNYTKAKEAPPEPVQAKVPTLRPMQKSGDLFVDQSEDFALAGEKGIDHEKKAAEQALAKQTADEAASLQEKQQQPLFPVGEKPPEVPPVRPEAPPVIQPGEASSIQNSYVDAAREKRGLPPADEVGRRTWGTVWDEAKAKEAQDPDSGQRLVASLLETPRAINDLEDAQLLREQIKAQAQYDDAADAVNQAKKEGDDVALADAKARLELARDRVQDIYDAGKAAGTETGRGLNARKMLANENFELTRLEARARAAKGGEALTEDEAGRIKAARDEWVKAKEASDKVQEDRSKQAAQDIFDRVLHEIRKETEAAKEAKSKGSSSKDYWKNLREQALERERERRSRTYAIDPVSASLLHLKDEAIIGASHIAEKVIDFAEWSKRMISDLGEEIRPRLQQIYDRSKAYHDQINKEFEAKTEKGQKAPKVEKTPGQVLGEAKVEGGITKKVIFDLARAYVRQGDTDLGKVMDKVTADMKPIDPTLDSRKVRDIFSDYGKVKYPSKEADLKQLREFRALAQATSALEDIQKGKPPERSGMQRDKPTQKVREKQREVQRALKEFGIETVDPATQLKTSLDRVKTSLRNQIEDLEKQLATGEKTPKKNGVAYDQEANALKARRDALREQLQAIEGKTDMSDEQRNKVAIAAAKRSLEEYERRIKEKDFSERQKTNREPSPELAEIRAQRDAAREAFETLRDGPEKTADQINRERLLKAINKRADALEERLRTQDYGKPPKKAPLRDEKIDEARAREQRAKDKVNEEIEKIRLEQRTKAAKAGDFFVKFERAMKLSSLTTVLKLAAAAATRVGVTAPLEQGIVRGIRQVPGLSRLSEQAPNYTPIGMRAYAEAATKGVMRGIRDFKTVLKTGRSDLDVLNGKRADMDPIMLDWFGNLHGALKNPVKQAAFEIAYKRLSEFNLKRGIDIQDPATVADMSAKAYLEAKKSIFMQDNLVTDQWQTLLNILDKSKKYPDSGPWVARGLRFLLPIVKVPTNIVGETLKLNPVSLTKGLYEAGKAIRSGLENVPDEQKNHIMELLAKGSLGTAMMAIGYFNPENVGGYYQHQEKRKEGDVKASGFKLFGVNMPRWMFHAPMFEAIQMGATIRRVADSLDKNRQRKGVAAGVIAASIGLAKEQPFLDEVDRIGNALNNETERRYFAGSLLRSTIIPPGVQQIASMTDKKDKSVKPPETPMQYLAYPFQEPVKRNPGTLLQHVEMGIPYLRQNVPEKR